MKMSVHAGLCWHLLFVAAAAVAEPPSIEVTLLDARPVLDGVIGEDEWPAPAVDGHFIQVEPSFGEPSPYRTVVRIGQTESALYVAFEAFDPDLSRLAAAATVRDGRLDDDDSVGVVLDTFGDGRTAYFFRTNALATQQDGRIADNGRTDDLRWDEAWRCAASLDDDRWTAEFEIPFSILRFAAGDESGWGLNLIRTVPRRLEIAGWAGPAESVWRVSGFGALTGLELKGRGAKSWQVIPYVLASATEGESDLDGGVDLRWRPSSSLGVDATVNPDFALIEADVETINLSRFELFVPEKRPFFLEGNEMFTQRMRQFYSRRVGDITWGAKANGKLGKKTDFSAIVTSEDLTIESSPGTGRATYTVARFQRGLSRGSTVGLLAANRQLDTDDAGSIGLDATLFFTDTLGFTGQLLQVHGSNSDGGLAWFVRPAYDSATTHFHVRYTNLDTDLVEDFNTVGFLRDDDRREVDSNLRHSFWIESGAVERVRARTNYNRYWSQENVLRSWELDTEIEVVFRGGWEMELSYVDELQIFEKEFRNDRTELSAGRDGVARPTYAGTGCG